MLNERPDTILVVSVKVKSPSRAIRNFALDHLCECNTLIHANLAAIRKGNSLRDGGN